jgi:hypothetical protein
MSRIQNMYTGKGGTDVREVFGITDGRQGKHMRCPRHLETNQVFFRNMVVHVLQRIPEQLFDLFIAHFKNGIRFFDILR